MRSGRKLRGVGAALAAMALVGLGTPASAQPEGFNPATCLLPDNSGPVFYNFLPGPTEDLTQPGTFMQITVDDIPNYRFESGWANRINLVELRIDGGEPVGMTPAKGNHRKVRQEFHITLGALDLAPGPHVLSFRGRDDCGLVGTHTESVFLVAPGLVATCGLPVDRLC